MPLRVIPLTNSAGKQKVMIQTKNKLVEIVVSPRTPMSELCDALTRLEKPRAQQQWFLKQKHCPIRQIISSAAKVDSPSVREFGVESTADDGDATQRGNLMDVSDVVDPATLRENYVSPVELSTSKTAHQQTPTPIHSQDGESFLEPSLATEKGDGRGLGTPDSYEAGAGSAVLTPDIDETKSAPDRESTAAGKGVVTAPVSLGSKLSSVVAVAMWTLIAAAATVGMACVVVAWSARGIARRHEPELEPPDEGGQARTNIEPCYICIPVYT